MYFCFVPITGIGINKEVRFRSTESSFLLILLCFFTTASTHYGLDYMNRLYTYLCNIHALPSTVCTVRKTENIEKSTDGDNLTEECETIYEFNNGVKILCKTESDTFQSDDICCECWISYEVVHDGGYLIHPLKKQFYNRCQEKFWMKMQKHLD